MTADLSKCLDANKNLGFINFNYTKIYSALRFSDMRPKYSVMVTHVTIFEHFVQRTNDIGYKK